MERKERKSLFGAVFGDFFRCRISGKVTSETFPCAKKGLKTSLAEHFFWTPLFALLYAAAVFAFVSCDGLVGGSMDDIVESYTGSAVPDSNESVELSVVFDTQAKSLSVVGNTEISSYKYTALCLSNPLAYGAKESLTELEVLQGKAKITVAPGMWNISIYGYNSDGGLVVEGSSGSVSISPATKTVSISLSDANGASSSSVRFSLGAPKVDGGVVNVKYASTLSALLGKQAADRVINEYVDNCDFEGTREGYARFSDNMTIPAGTYIMQILYMDGSSKISGQILGFKAVEKTVTEVKGNFDYGRYVMPDFDIGIEPTMLEVELSGTAPAYTAQVKTSGVEDLTYSWIVNGDECLEGETGATLSWAPPECGVYNITCIVSGKVGGKTLYGFGYGVYTKEE